MRELRVVLYVTVDDDADDCELGEMVMGAVAASVPEIARVDDYDTYRTMPNGGRWWGAK